MSDFLNVVLILANSVDPDEMQHYAAFHLGLHCLRKVPAWGFPVYKGKCISRRHKQTKEFTRFTGSKLDNHTKTKYHFIFEAKGLFSVIEVCGS